MDRLVIGVDMAKASFVAAAWLTEGAVGLGCFRNTPEGRDTFCARVAALQQEQQATSAQVVLEPTGGYELALVAQLATHHYTVVLPNPRQVRDWAKSQGRRAKTDAQDAVLLAHYGASHAQLVPFRPLPAPVATLAALLERQQVLESLLQQERNHGEALTQLLDLPPAVQRSLSQLQTALQDELRGIATAITEHLQVQAALQEELRLLQTVPGVGKRTAPWLLVLLYRWSVRTDGVGRAKGLTAYVGVDPQPYESGTSVRRRAHISRQGNAALRSRLYFAAFGGVRTDNALRAFYQRLVGRGKAKKLALVAASRKLLVWSWAVFRTHTAFDPARVSRPPVAVSA
jgi:transposase